MMLIYPYSPVPKSADISIQYPADMHSTAAGFSMGQTSGPSVLSITLDYNDGISAVGQNELQPLWSFLVRCQGRLNEFSISLPVLDGEGPLCPGVTTAAASAGAVYVALSGLPAGRRVRRAGDLIQFSSRPRAYMLAQDLVSDSNGNALAQLLTPLLSDLAAGAVVGLDALVLQCRLSDDTVRHMRKPGGIRSLKAVSMVEVIRYA